VKNHIKNLMINFDTCWSIKNIGIRSPSYFLGITSDVKSINVVITFHNRAFEPGQE